MASIKRFFRSILATAASALVISAPALGAQAPGTLKVLYHFGYTEVYDDPPPCCGVVMDAQHNLYGVTQGEGGGEGLVYEYSAAGKFSVIHDFSSCVSQPNSPCTNKDGGSPSGGVILDSRGLLHGATSRGGRKGTGTVFKMSPDGGFRTLYDFPPESLNTSMRATGRPVLDASGNLYVGTKDLKGGGAISASAIVKVTPDGVKTTVHRFGYNNRVSDLSIDGAGNIYGTTESGGPYGEGVVFKITPGGTTSLLHSFGRSADEGTAPSSGVIFDRYGNIYGVTGTSVYRIKPDGTFIVLHKFSNDRSQGYFALGGLAMDAAGNLYGITRNGGKHEYGLIFKLTPTKQYSVLFSFKGRDQSGFPNGSLLLDDAGNLYGTNFGYGGDTGGSSDGGSLWRFKLP